MAIVLVEKPLVPSYKCIVSDEISIVAAIRHPFNLEATTTVSDSLSIISDYFGYDPTTVDVSNRLYLMQCTYIF